MITPGNLQLFVVYHRRAHPAFYAQLSPAHLAGLVFYKVNEAIPFEMGLEPRHVTLVREYDLPVYDPFYQAHAYNEGSCMVHVHQNGLADDADYVGIVQYDMGVSDAHIRYWQDLMAKGTEIIACADYGVVDPALCLQDYVRDPPFYGFPMGYVVERFCRTFAVDRDAFIARMRQRQAAGQQLALLNSFIVKRALFDKLAAWILEISKDLHAYTLSHSDQAQHHGHMGGIIERCLGLFFLFHLPDGQKIEPMGVQHVHVPEWHRTRYGQS